MTFGYYDAPNPSRDKVLYYYNGSKPGERSMLTSAALIAHELVPGHHFQIALQHENKDLPAFRQDYFTTAFVEGWGEYASDFAQRMGMYNDPYDMAGRLMMDAHLSSRLVVDTGMNALGWSREKGVAVPGREHPALGRRDRDGNIALRLRHSRSSSGVQDGHARHRRRARALAAGAQPEIRPAGVPRRRSGGRGVCRWTSSGSGSTGGFPRRRGGRTEELRPVLTIRRTTR
jgi:hypothetical protein